jgi:predicted TIM-barrel fold metal-dependent hydrolase
MTRAALAVAPTSKLLYSSDGHSIPEHVWLGARRGREIVAAALEEMVAARELRPGMAEDAGAGLLRENARRVYRLDDAVLVQP